MAPFVAHQDSRGAFGHAAVKTDLAPLGNLAMPLQFRLINIHRRDGSRIVLRYDGQANGRFHRFAVDKEKHRTYG